MSEVGASDITYPGGRIEIVMVLEVDVAKPASPLYTAVTGYVPVGKVVVVYVATPPLTGWVATTTPLAENATVPEGEDDVTEELMVAVSVTLVPGGTGDALVAVEVSVVIVAASDTGTVRATAVLPAKLLSPL